ncbi:MULTISPECIES: ABC transporter ATP-binding protein [unclassified Mesobacillus]|uniref:ABC transporter ATP-binding protein n=1 Tax=unclassified Mesobacillus TaxID=2675270 RepID=UPI00203E18A8|nr:MULTISPECIES: ABC transporter ATP-binding protein [unclassified Mesobacillus]MCM3124221.1 ABC transporter ATP-binding protein [Mesobacillus sp. MER 33]MCM3234070.1 ABC transporter ATP-binding protein [Mesobacillus sp. MER 48]
MASIKIENVQKAFGKVVAVDHLNLEINDGEFFTFLGPSGCGKTTTLRMIAGFYYPTKGVVRFGDKDMTRVPPEKRNTGMVFQNYALFPHMTVFENVAFGLKVRKMASSEVKTRVHEVLRKVRLEQYADRQVSQLSGGQQQRVALARALVIEPEILLLDEPLSNLDAKLRDEMRAEILRLQKEYKITTIYVTHDQAEALSMSDRIAVFNFGVCHQVGTPSEIYNEPANDFVASFIGEINLLPVKVEQVDDAHVTVSAGENQFVVHNTPFHFKRENEDRELSLSVRPESVKILDEKVDRHNVFKGKVETVQFFGTIINLAVRVNDLLLEVNVLNHVSANLKPGADVWVELPADQIRLIPMLSGDVS